MPRSLGNGYFRPLRTRDALWPLLNTDSSMSESARINSEVTVATRKGGGQQQTEDALRQSLEDLTRMQQLSTRLLQAGDFSLLLHDILDAAIAITSTTIVNRAK